MTAPTLRRRVPALAGLHPSLPVREVEDLQPGPCRGDLHAHAVAQPAAVAVIHADRNGRRIAACEDCLVTTAHRAARSTAGAIHVEVPQAVSE